MKRIATVVLLASMAGSALAAGPSNNYVPGFVPGMPYSQLDVDQALPNVKDPVIDQPASAGATQDEDFSGFEPGRTYEQTQVDRELPDVKDPVITKPSVQVAGPLTGSSAFTEATGPWANDWNFIAPPP
jgi:hypothetical protein